MNVVEALKAEPLLTAMAPAEALALAKQLDPTLSDREATRAVLRAGYPPPKAPADDQAEPTLCGRVEEAAMWTHSDLGKVLGKAGITARFYVAGHRDEAAIHPQEWARVYQAMQAQVRAMQEVMEEVALRM